MFEIELSRQAEKFYQWADTQTVRRLNACFEKLAQNPYTSSRIKKLRGEFQGSYRYRIGKLRVIYSVDVNKNVIYIEVMDSRKQVYRKR